MTGPEPAERPCVCWSDPPHRGPHDGHCCTGLHTRCHEDVWEAIAADHDWRQFSRLPHREKDAVLAATVARIYPKDTK